MLYASFESTPIDAVDSIKHLLKGKVYDLGGGDGTFALAMSQYADVTSIELQPQLAAESRVKVVNDSYLTVPLDCDVIYTFLSFTGMYALTQRLLKEKWHGTLISNYYPLQQSSIAPLTPDKIIHCDLETVKVLFLVYHL